MRRLAFIAALVLAACNGDSGTEPGLRSTSLKTAHGAVSIGPGVDAGRVVAAVEAGYARAHAQIGDRADALRLDGLQVDTADVELAELRASGAYFPGVDILQIRTGGEAVIAHELQHRFCYGLGGDGECCAMVDHNGGYNLDCRPL